MYRYIKYNKFYFPWIVSKSCETRFICSKHITLCFCFLQINCTEYSLLLLVLILRFLVTVWINVANTMMTIHLKTSVEPSTIKPCISNAVHSFVSLNVHSVPAAQYHEGTYLNFSTWILQPLQFRLLPLI